ncbi:MAG TPA: helix-turn-helix domain-containing protein [Bryobacteraceae bacterium]|nr:helix-turn-helix domain-containing protein [Bryobacteraceae bacterium]
MTQLERQCKIFFAFLQDDERILTRKAFNVPEYLVDQRRRLVKQDKLLDALWPNTHVRDQGSRAPSETPRYCRAAHL